jgi:RNA-directed DNA polymerase
VKGKRSVGVSVQLVLPLQLRDEARNSGASTDAGPAKGVPPSVASTGLETSGARRERKQKHATLYHLVTKDYTLWHAWLQVERNRGAAGSDGMTIAHAQSRLRPFLRGLRRDLRAKRYRPRPVRRHTIPKPDGGERTLGIPCVRDRIVQTAVAKVLEPIFEAKFSHRSHGFRPGRGCQTALEQVDRALQAGYQWVVDADIERFFDTVDHQRVIQAVNEEVADGTVLRLIGWFLRAGVLDGTTRIEVEEGTPQGGPLSPLLANIYLHPLDMALEAHGYEFVRYADDFVVLARTQAEAEAALRLIREVLTELGLRLNEAKTRVVHLHDGFEFLGFRYFRSRKRGTVHKVVREKSQARFREEVRQRTPRRAGQKPRKARSCTVNRLRRDQRLARMIGELNSLLRGWHGYFRQVWWAGRRDFEQLDKFLRRRLRSAIAGRLAIGRWQSEVLPNALLDQLGLLSLVGLHDAYLEAQLRNAQTGAPGGSRMR